MIFCLFALFAVSQLKLNLHDRTFVKEFVKILFTRTMLIHLIVVDRGKLQFADQSPGR